MRPGTPQVVVAMLVCFVLGGITGAALHRRAVVEATADQFERSPLEAQRRALLTALERRVGLDDEELARVAAALDQQMEKNRALRREIEPRARALRAETSERVRAGLAEDKRARFDAFVEQNERRIAEWVGAPAKEE
ncbi:MAG: hypothetical protein ACOYM9_18155 [Bradymonadia bacterium]